jgi:uncharacterized GH25 family protein
VLCAAVVVVLWPSPAAGELTYAGEAAPVAEEPGTAATTLESVVAQHANAPTRAPSPARTEIVPPTARVQIVDVDTQRPVPGLTVAVSQFVLEDDSVRTLGTAATDADGYVSLGLCRGTAVACALLDSDYYFTSDAYLEDSGQALPATLFVRAGTRLMGRVVDGGGHGVAGARVSVNFGRGIFGEDAGEPQRATAMMPAAVAWCTTEQDGSYVLRGVARDDKEWKLIVEHPGFALGEHTVAVPEHRGAVAVLPVVLQPGALLRLRVIDDVGQPIGGLEVNVFPEVGLVGSHCERMRAVGVTDAGGCVSFPRCRAGKYEVAVAAGYKVRESTLDVADLDQLVNVTAVPCMTVTGSVRDAAGAPVRRATVTLRTTSPATRASTRTADDGTFVFRAATKAPSRLSVRAPGYRAVTAEYDVDALARPVDVRLQRSRDGVRR